MGHNESKQNAVIEELKQQIAQLVSSTDEQKEIQRLKNIEKNNDSKISKEELIEWANKKNTELEEFKSQIMLDLENQKHIEYEVKYMEMQKQIDALLSVNKSLEAKLMFHETNNLKQNDDRRFKALTGQNDQNAQTPKHIANLNQSEISIKQMDMFVEKLLNDKNVNIKYLPDFVEKQLYRNVFTILLGLIENLVDSVEIQLMGHRISMYVTPVSDDAPINEVSPVAQISYASQSSALKQHADDRTDEIKIADSASYDSTTENPLSTNQAMNLEE